MNDHFSHTAGTSTETQLMVPKKEKAVTNRESLHATVFDYSRDVNGNPTAHFVIQRSPGGFALYSSRRRQQIGYGDKDLAAVNAFLKTFEGGGWNLAWVHENGPSVVCAGFEREKIVPTCTNSDGLRSQQVDQAHRRSGS